MNKYIYLSVFLMILNSCKKNNKTLNNSEMSSVNFSQDKIIENSLNSWKYLEDIPSEIDGFSCVYYENDTSNILMADEGNIAYINLGDSVLKLDFYERSLPDSSIIYKSNDIIISVNLNRGDSVGYEVNRVEGELELTLGKNRIKKNFFGYCSY